MKKKTYSNIDAVAFQAFEMVKSKHILIIINYLSDFSLVITFDKQWNKFQNLLSCKFVFQQNYFMKL